MKKLEWGLYGPWAFLKEVRGEDSWVAGYRITTYNDGTVAVECEYEFKIWMEIAQFPSEEEAKAYAEVCYLMGVKHE